MLLSLLAAGCATQDATELESAPRDNVPEIDEQGRRGGNIVVLTDFGAVDASSPAASVETGEDCRTLIWLRSVYYGGDDVGSDWQYVVSVEDSDWISGRRSLSPRALDRIERRVYESRVPGCGRARGFAVTVRAREFDVFLDETAVGFGFALLPCEKTPTHTSLEVLVPVVESPSFLEPQPTAALVFVFQCETQCIAARAER